MTKITSAIAAALIASASFASVALAEGDYYEGVSRGQQAEAVHKAQSVSYGYTGSVSNAQGSNQSFDGTVILNRGDYYEGAVRPN